VWFWAFIRQRLFLARVAVFFEKRIEDLKQLIGRLESGAR